MGHQTEREQKTIEIRAMSINLTPEVGANDQLVSVRVVPDGRDGNVVFARTLRCDEVDDGTPVVVDRLSGEQLRFRPGSIQISIKDVDRFSKPGPDGYAPITSTIWTWLSIGPSTRPDLFRYLLAAARRLDGTHELLVQTTGILSNLSGNFVEQREQVFKALSLAEILTVALGRSIDMMDRLTQSFPVELSLPPVIEAKNGSIREIRNAFEHIDDRALGQANKKPHPDALSVFSQSEFLDSWVVTYGKHSIDLRIEVPQMLVDARQYVYDVAVSITGPIKIATNNIQFFTPEDAPPG